VDTALTADYPAPDSDMVDVYDFMGALRKRLWLVAVCAVAFCAAATTTAYLMKPIYRSKASLYPQTSDINPLTAGLIASSLSALGGSIAAVTGGITESDRETDEAMTVLQSREFNQKFIEQNHLLPLLFPKLWDAERGRWKDGVEVPTLARGFVAFEKIRKIDLDDDNDFITVQVDWTDPVVAADWVNRMVNMVNEELRQRSLASSTASLNYLRDELPRAVDIQTQRAIAHMIENQLNQKMLASVTPEFELRFVTRALPAEREHPAYPNKILVGAIGLLLGGLIGVAVALVLYRRELTASGRLWTGPTEA
jgi:uncharacterized protein involved in exopolysaccharide biosynthesis